MSVDEAELIAGMQPTGRRLATPAAELIEVQDARGLKHLAWRAQEIHRNHPSLTGDLQLGWMEHPEVTGLARLTHHDPDEGLFVYATGTCFTVAEIVRVYAEEETGAGVKAGLELCYLVAEALSEAAEAAAELGIFSHGNLNPWNIVVKPDGQPLILGYGLPQVEMRVFQEDPRRVPKEDSFRYVPPERLEGHDEDIASDIFALALVGLELMVGRPVYDGLLDDIRQQATRGEGMRRLYQWREKLPANVREVLGRALKPDPDTRYRRGLDFVYAVHDLLGSIDVEGPSLIEVMAKVRAVTKRGKGPIVGGRTGMLTPEELRELAADLDEIDAQPLPPPRQPRPEPEAEATEEEEGDGSPAPRWQRRKGAEPPPPPDPKAEARDRLKRRLRRSGTNAEGAPSAAEEDARERLRRRLRESSSRGGGGDDPRRRLRRGDAEEAVPDRRRRRRAGEVPAAVSQSIDLGDPLGFDEEAESTDIDLAPVELPDLPELGDVDDDEPETAVVERSEPPQIGRVVATVAEEKAPPPPPPPPPLEPEPEPASPLSHSGGAAALLERLRGSTGERRRRRPRATPAVSLDEDEGENTVAVRRPAAPTPRIPEPEPPAPPPTLPPPPTAEELEPERVIETSDTPAPTPAPRLPASDFLEEPDEPVDSTLKLAGEPIGDSEPTSAIASRPPLLVDDVVRVVAPDGREVPLPLLDDDCVASVVQRAVVVLGLLRVDLQGRPTAGWRGRVGDHPLPGATRIEGIERLHLVEVPRAEHRLVVELDGQRIHLLLPGCVSVGSVLPAIAALFGVTEPVRATFGGGELPAAVLVGELVRKPLVLVR